MNISDGPREVPVDRVQSQLPLPGIAGGDPLESSTSIGAAANGEDPEPITPPSFSGSEPQITKPAAGRPSPSEKAQLARIEAEGAQGKARAEAEIRDRDARRAAEERDRDQRRAAEIETEKAERDGRQLERRVFLALAVFSAVAVTLLAFVALQSDSSGLLITPSAPVTVFAGACLRLRALDRSRSSTWGWLSRKGE